MGLDSVGRILAESIPGRVDRTRRAIWLSRGECNPSSWPPDQPRVNNRARGYGSRGRDAHATPRRATSSSDGPAPRISRLAPPFRRRSTPSWPSSPCPSFSHSLCTPVSFTPFFFRTRSQREASLSEVFGRLRDSH